MIKRILKAIGIGGAMMAASCSRPTDDVGGSASMSDESYVAFFNNVVMKCPFCDTGEIKPCRMRKKGDRIYDESAEIVECDHLLAFGNYSPARCAGSLESFRAVQTLANSPTEDTPDTVQYVVGQAFAFYCRDVHTFLEQAKDSDRLDGPLTLDCPFCSASYPVPLPHARDEDFCEHAFLWRSVMAGWNRSELDDLLFAEAHGDHRVSGEDVLFSALSGGSISREIRPIIRSAWAFDPETGADRTRDGEGIFSVIAFTRDKESMRALKNFLKDEISRPAPREAESGSETEEKP